MRVWPALKFLSSGGATLVTAPVRPPHNNPADTLLAEADRLVATDRQDSYGHPFDMCSRVAGLWSVLFAKEISAEDVAMAMVLMKVAREMNTPKRDNAVDIAGYAKVLAMIHDRRREMAVS
jgi:hypothetical protein